MKKHKIFIDGSVGTTGLQIEERLMSRPELELIPISEAQRKNPDEIKKRICESEITFLCLPDAAAVEAVALAEGSGAKIIDASTAHRTAPNWSYGFPELGNGFRESIIKSSRVAVPGCHASGFISLIYPLVKSGVISASAGITATSLTGYSGGGKKLIAKYESAERNPSSYKAPMPYALSLSHKHLPEMKAVCGLENAPVFMPVVGNYYKGMLVSVPLFEKDLNVSPEKLTEIYKNHYPEGGFVKIMPFNADLTESGGFLNPEKVNDTNDIEIYVFAADGRVLLASVLDNLGKGSGGAAVQCMNLMLGLDERAGL